MPDNQSTTSFKADISQLRSEMQAAARLVRVANSEFKAATSGMDSWSSSADGLQKKIKQLNTILSAQKRQVALAEQEWEKTKKAYGENSAEADRAKIKLNNYQAAVGKTEKELDRYENELDNVGKETQETSKQTEKASEGFTVMKGALANLVASGIKAAISGLKDLANAAKEAYEEFDEGEDAVIKATGATGAEAEKLKEAYKSVTQSVVGDLGQIGSALGEIVTRFGFTGSELETATIEFQKFADVTGTDAAEAVRLVSRAMGDAGIDAKDYGEVLDMLTTASQKSGISVDTLADSLTKYGAPMRNLGFDTKESIAIFSSWEKAGVNTQIAFSGMRKAISNWSKDGKDAREEFKKTLKEIESTPSRAKATQKAIEIFGAKAGPDLADAILEGRFAYEDFLSLIEDSSGSLDGTYDATLDGYDKVKLAIQSAKAELGSFVGDILTKYQPQIEAAIATGTEKVKELVTYVITNKETVISTLTTIGKVLGTIFVTSRITSFVATLQTVAPAFIGLATKIGLLTTVEDAAEGATLALNTALLANPAMWVVGGVAALAGVMIKLRSDQQKAMESTYGLSDAEEKLNKSIQDRYDKQKQAESTRDTTVQGIASESNYTRKLVSAYNDLVGKNGQVSKKNKEHADFILNQLASALGVEREEIEKLIGKNGKLGESIDKLIAKKQAESTLNAYEESYSQAKQNEQQALNDIVEAQNNYTAAQQQMKDVQTQYNAAYQEWMDKIASGQATAQEQPAELMRLQEALSMTKTKLDEQKTALDNANTAYSNSQTTIKNYEALQEAVFSGNTKKIKQSLNAMTGGLKTATSATRKELETQVQDRKSFLDKVLAAQKAGNPAITKEVVEGAKKQYKDAKKELDKMPKEYKESGKKSGNAYASGQSSAKGKSKKAGQSLGKAGVEGEKSGSKQAKKTGQKAGKDYSQGMTSASKESKKAGEKVSKEGKKAVEKGGKDNKKTGQKAGKDYSEGLKSQKGSASAAGKSVGSSGKSGIKSGQGSAGETAGKELGEGYARGIRSKIPAAKAAAAALAKAGTKQVKKTQKSGSPSKLTYKSGQEFTQGYVLGIASLESQVQTTVKGMVKNVVSQMLKMSQFNFSDVGSAASSIFSEGISQKVSYTVDRITYENEAKLKDFDNTIADLEKKKSAASSKLQKDSDKKQANIQKKLDKAKKESDKKKYKKQLEQEKSRVAKLIKASDKSYDKLINTQNKYKEAYQAASSAMLSEFQNAMNEYQTKAQALIDDTINGITERYQQNYDALIAKQDQLIEKLKSAGDLFEISGAGVMTINDIKKQTEAINDYTSKLAKIKSKVSEELFDQITSYDMDQGSAFMSRLLEMSASDLDAYNKAYTEKMKAAEKAGETIYKADFAKLKTSYEAEINKAFKDLPKQLEDLGTQAMKGFLSGFTTNTNYMSKEIKTFVKGMVATFKKQLKIKSPSKVMFEIGDYTMQGFTEAIKDSVSAVRAAVNEVASEVSTPLSGMSAGAGLVRSTASGGIGGSSSVSNVTNNYNLVQNNTSPKPLSALETYQARRRQISMVKALTQAI